MRLYNSILFVILFITIGNISSTEIYTYFSMDNFHFNSDNEIVNSDYDFEYGEIVTQEVSDDLFIEAGFEKSIITDYIVSTNFIFDRDHFGFNLGIFTSFLNDSSKILTPGLSYGLEFTLPGLMLINLNIDNTIPNTTALEDGATINNYDLKVGFYIGETIVSGNIHSESSSKGSMISTTSTTDTRYFLNMDLFNKYTSYRISMDLGWQHLTRTVTDLSVDDDDTLSGSNTTNVAAGSVFFDTEFTLILNDIVSLNAGTILHLLNFPLNDLESFNSDEFNWGANLGCTIKL